MALRKYALPLPTHRPIDRKLIKKGMSVARRPSSSPRTSRSKVAGKSEVADSNNETERERTTGTSKVVRTSKRLQEKKAAVGEEGLPTAVKKHVDELEDYTSGSA